MAKQLKKPHGLLELIRDDVKLTPDIKMEYITLAQSYSDNFRENLNKTSMELDESFSYGIDTWKQFLNYPPVKSYIEAFRRELISQSVNEAMITGNKAKDAISIKKEIERENASNTFENFVVFRLPDKEEVEYEYSGQF